MNQGISVIIYPVRDLDRAKRLYRELLGTEPYADTPCLRRFPGWRPEIGLDPPGAKVGVV